MIGFAFCPPDTVAMAIDRLRFRYHTIVSDHVDELEMFDTWLGFKDHRKTVALVADPKLLTRKSTRSRLERVGSIVVFAIADVLTCLDIPIVDSVIMPDGTWSMKISVDAVNTAIDQDTIDIKKVVKMPSILAIKDDLPEEMNLANTLSVIKDTTDHQVVKPYLPLLAGFLAGTVKQKDFKGAWADMLTAGIRPDALDEFYFYCTNMGRTTKAAYATAVSFNKQFSDVADYFAGENMDRDMLEKEMVLIDDLLRSGTKNIKFLRKPSLPSQLTHAAKVVNESNGIDTLDTYTKSLGRRLKRNLVIVLSHRS